MVATNNCTTTIDTQSATGTFDIVALPNRLQNESCRVFYLAPSVLGCCLVGCVAGRCTRKNECSCIMRKRSLREKNLTQEFPTSSLKSCVGGLALIFFSIFVCLFYFSFSFFLILQNRNLYLLDHDESNIFLCVELFPLLLNASI